MGDTEAVVVSKGPCEACGSSDAKATYSDGGTYCYSITCRKFTKGETMDDESKPNAIRAVPKKSVGLVSGGEQHAWTTRGLTAATCAKWGIEVGDYKGQKVRLFNYKSTTGRTVAQKLRTANKDFKFLGDTGNSGLFGQHLWRDGGKRIVITEGEIDAATISQMQGHKWPVVSIPNGCSGAKKSLQKNFEWLDTYDEIILCFDQDEPGRLALEECAPLFQPGKVKVAKLGEYKDPNEMLLANKGKELVAALWEAKVHRPDGIVKAEDLWDTLSETVENHSVTFPWQGLQAKALGAQLGEVITLTAGSGIGKTAMIREIAHHLVITEGEPIGMLMFEETVKRTALGLMAITMNKNLALMSNPEKEAGFHDAFKSTFNDREIFLYDHFGSTSFDNVISKIRYLANGAGAKWIFVDHLSILVSGMQDGDERRLIDNAMTALKTVAMECNVGIFIVSHLKRPNGDVGHEQGAMTTLAQLRGSAAIGQLSDKVIGFERNQQHESTYLSNVTTIRCLKDRRVGDLGVAGWLHFNRTTGRLEELLDDPYTTKDDFDDGSEIF